MQAVGAAFRHVDRTLVHDALDSLMCSAHVAGLVGEKAKSILDPVLHGSHGVCSGQADNLA